jgi:hypothetical protein
MKKMVFLGAFALATALALPALADSTAADKAYSQRDYTAPGIKKAQEAADLYAQEAAHATDPQIKAKNLAGQAEALYFVGAASQANAEKINKHLQGMNVADQAVAIFGIKDVTKVSPDDVKKLKSLPADQLAVLASSLYQRGINLGQWGAANGVMKSLSKWPELKANMQVIIDLGQGKINDYGPYRVLGRGYFKIPSMLGGSVDKAIQYLSSAVKGSKAAGQIYSVNGFNNTYLAEALNSNGKTADAKQLLNEFLKADPKTLNPILVPENQQAQSDAKELLKSW